MLEEGEKGSVVAEEVVDKPLDERKVGPTSIDVTDEQPGRVDINSKIVNELCTARIYQENLRILLSFF
jgi:hypothetical protein